MAAKDDDRSGLSALTEVLERLLPCPFCGGQVELESAGLRGSHVEGKREFWGVVCRNTTNVGGSCCMEQVPSASKKAAIDRWNMRNGVRSKEQIEPRRPLDLPDELTQQPDMQGFLRKIGE